MKRLFADLFSTESNLVVARLTFKSVYSSSKMTSFLIKKTLPQVYSTLFCVDNSVIPTCYYCQSKPGMSYWLGVVQEEAEKMETEDPSTFAPANKKYLIDTNNIRLPRPGMEMATFMKECMSR